MSFRFQKMQGSGNDFIFLDYLQGELGPRLHPKDVAFLCDRHYGIGADGLVVLKPSEMANAEWDFFNCDGSVAEMCGNAARCAILYLSERYFPGVDIPLTLKTRAGIVHGKRSANGEIEIAMIPIGQGLDYHEKNLKAGDEAFETFCVNTGVPHAVIEVKDLRTYPIDRIGRALVSHPAFPQGSNITFFQRLSGLEILATTFERGVELETLACGTGVAAAAFVYSERYLRPFPIRVTVPGGELVVDVTTSPRMLTLTGPAQFVMVGEIDSIPATFEAPAPFGAKRRRT